MNQLTIIFHNAKQTLKEELTINSLDDIDNVEVSDRLSQQQSVSFVDKVLDSRCIFISDCKFGQKCVFKESGVGSSSLTGEEIIKIIKKCPKLQELQVTNLTPDLLEFILRFCPYLECLQFESVEEDFSQIWTSSSLQFDEPPAKRPLTESVTTCNNITMLICPHDVTEDTLSVLLKNIPNLETLIIRYSPEGKVNHGITGKCFQYLGKSIKHLILGNIAIKKDFISWILKNGGRDIEELEMLFPILGSYLDQALQLTNLRKLTIKACDCSFSSITKISSLSHLESLQVERLDLCNDTLEEIFAQIFNNCRNLREFKVSGTFKLYSHQLFDIITSNSLQLTHLSILPNMYKSEINWLRIEITKSFDKLKSLTNLQHLALPYSDLTDNNLKELVESCPKLTVIDLSHCKKITDISSLIHKIENTPELFYQVFLSLSSVKSIEKIPPNSKICACNYHHNHGIFLSPRPYYDLI